MKKMPLKPIAVWDHAFQEHTGKKGGLYIVTNELMRKMRLYKVGKAQVFNNRFNTYRQAAGAENIALVLAVIEIPRGVDDQISLTDAERIFIREMAEFVDFQKNPDTDKTTEWFRPKGGKERYISWGLDRAKHYLWNEGCKACVLREGDLRADRQRGTRHRPDIEIVGVEGTKLRVKVGDAAPKLMGRKNSLLVGTDAIRKHNITQSIALQRLVERRAVSPSPG